MLLHSCMIAIDLTPHTKVSHAYNWVNKQSSTILSSKVHTDRKHDDIRKGSTDMGVLPRHLCPITILSNMLCLLGVMGIGHSWKADCRYNSY